MLVVGPLSVRVPPEMEMPARAEPVKTPFQLEAPAPTSESVLFWSDTVPAPVSWVIDSLAFSSRVELVATTTLTASLIASPPATERTPALTVTLPVKVSMPERARVPAPSFVRPTVPPPIGPSTESVLAETVIFGSLTAIQGDRCRFRDRADSRPTNVKSPFQDLRRWRSRS